MSTKTEKSYYTRVTETLCFCIGLIPQYARKITLLVFFASISVSVYASEVSEYELKVAYIYNFSKFVTWPEAASEEENLYICVVSTDSDIDVFNTLNARAVGSLTIKINYIEASDVTAFESCNLLYIDTTIRSEFLDIAASVKGKPILVVGELPSIESVAMISLRKIESKLKFEINLKEIRASQMEVSSYLLKLAINIYE